MNKKDIIVTVSGCTGMGTTTIAEMITRFLATNEFDVKHDPGLDGPRPNTGNAQALREASVKENVKIVVNEAQISRQSGAEEW